jgi:hypothetical protein
VKAGDIVQASVAQWSGAGIIFADSAPPGLFDTLLNGCAAVVFRVIRYPGLPDLVPFGTGRVVAITAPRQMANLEHALQRFDRRSSAGQLVDVISRFAPADARIGLVGLFTAP